MEIKKLSCPLCLQPNFENVDSLRTTLISAATSHLSCPVCNESLLGLDKLTIHLFGHIHNTLKNKNVINASQVNKEKAELAAASSFKDNVPQQKLTQNKNDSASSSSVQDEINKSINKIKKDHCNEKIKHEAKPNLEIIRCDICNFCFTDQNILDMHQKLLHQTPPDKKTGQYHYHCHLCSKKFKMRGSLMVHLRVAHYGFTHNHHDMSINNLAVVNNTEEAKVEKKSGKNCENNKQWACDVCSKLFTTKYFLKKHKRLHTGEMPYSCTQCNKSFTFQQSYHKHMLYHSTEKPYSCNECGRAFKELSTLQNHQRIHSGERPFVCENCGKKFRQRVSYLVHRRIHTGVMPYKCTACDKTFRYKVSQRSHKCPMNPPGSVVKIPESMDDTNASTSNDNSQNILSSTSLNNSINNNNNVKCIMSVDYSTGNINFYPEQFSNENPNQQIQISYNKVDLETNGANKETSQKTNFAQELNLLVPPDTGDASDLFSVVMSPLLPEVASLCLSNESPLDNNKNNNNGNSN